MSKKDKETLVGDSIPKIIEIEEKKPPNDKIIDYKIVVDGFISNLKDEES